jgi:HEAT repeat protein
MKGNRLKLVLVACGTFLLVLLAIFRLQPSQPVYNRRPVSAWLDDWEESSGHTTIPPQRERAAEAEHAIQQMGTAATPWLAKRIRADNSPRRRVYRFAYDRLPVAIQRWLAPPKPVRDWFVWKVVNAFGAEAKVAVPQLLQFSTDPNPGIRCEALFDLCRITADPKYIGLLLQWMPQSEAIYQLSSDGVEAIPRLELALRSGDAQVRETAVRALAFIGDKAGSTAPVIGRLLRDPAVKVRLAAAEALRQIGPNRRQAIPDLIQAIHDNHNEDAIQERALEVLGMIGPEAMVGAPDLATVIIDTRRGPAIRERAATSLFEINGDTNALALLLASMEQCRRSWRDPRALTDSVPADNEPPALTRCLRILGYLREIGAAGKQGAPAVVSLIENPGSGSDQNALRVKLINEAVDTLAAMEPEPSLEMPALLQLMRDPSPDLRLKALLELVRLGRSAKPVVPELISVIRSEMGESTSTSDYIKKCAAETLGKIGPHAGCAVPDLQLLLLHTNSSVRLEASIALWRITDPTNLVKRAVQVFEQTQDIKSRERIVEVLVEAGAVRKALDTIDPEALSVRNRSRP